MRTLEGDKSQVEVFMEKNVHTQTLQIFRFNSYQKEVTSTVSSLVFSQFLEIEHRLREGCHWEIALRNEKKNGRHGNSFTVDGVILCQIDNKIKDLRRRVWHETAKWWRARAYMVESSGFLARGFLSWRSSPKWYMHSILVEDCKARGGCCSRDCGCCTDPERAKTSAGPLGIGHCTLRCGCCKKSRGFEVNLDLEKMMSDVFLSETKTKGLSDQELLYRKRIWLASIWGLSVDGR